LFDSLVLRGRLFEWLFRSPKRIPGIFPISPKWRLVLFGLSTIQFARHPEGLVEHGKRQGEAVFNRLRRRPGPDTSTSAVDAEPATESVA